MGRALETGALAEGSWDRGLHAALAGKGRHATAVGPQRAQVTKVGWKHHLEHTTWAEQPKPC